MSDGRPDFSVIGAGLAGSLIAIFLGRAGHRVQVFERRLDPRRAGTEGGRSINLAISTRGLHALEQVGLRDQVLANAVPMRGRMIHSPTGRKASITTCSRHYLNISPACKSESLRR